MTKHEPTPDFVELVKDGATRRDPTLRRLAVASCGIEQSPQYFKDALTGAAAVMGPVLWGIVAHGPDDEADDPGTPMALRAQAAHWFMFGYDAGLWAVSPEQAALCRSLVRVHFGDEPMTEKTKADLAREAGLPTEDTVIKVRPKRAARISKQDTQRHIEIMQECSALNAVMLDDRADGEAKLAAARQFFAAMDYLAAGRLDASVERAAQAILAKVQQ